MRSSIFSSLISRSSIARSSLQGLIALSALVVLTGAKGQGCGGSDEPPTPPAPDCGPGFHWDTVCSPCEIGEMCEERCVPDSDCPPGWLEQTVCGGTTTSTAGVGGWTGDVGMPAPPVDPGCWTECVPPRPFCPPGTIEQTVCSGSSTSTATGGWGSASGSGVGGGFDGAMPAPPGDCWTECVPQEPYCPPGTRPQTTCDDVSTTVSVGVGTGGTGGAGGAGGWAPTGGAGAWDGSDSDSAGMAAPSPGNCWTDCVPDQPYCPPGTRPQTACEGSSSVGTSSVGVGGSGPGAGGTGGDMGWGGCWTECVPDQPYCPPDTIPQTVCGGSAVSVGSSGSTGTGYGGSGGSGGSSPYPGEEYCWTECVPAGPYCPPGSSPQEVCYDGMPETTTTSSGTGMGGSDGSSGTTSGGGWGGCFIECVPDQPYCPPDTIPQTVCADPMPGTTTSSGTGMGGSPYPGGGCWTECIPVEPYCPPGSIEQTVCSGSGSTGTGMGGYDSYPGECWTECVEGPTCPPGATVRTICEEPVGGGAGGPVCRTECVLMLP